MLSILHGRERSDNRLGSLKKRQEKMAGKEKSQGKNIWELSVEAVTAPETKKNQEEDKLPKIKIEKREQQTKNFDFRPVRKTENCRIIEATHDNIRDWKNDETGYYLIRIKEGKIEAGLCKEVGKVSILIIGKTAEEIYNTIIREDLVGTKQHAAYLGAELMKAEACLKLGKNYVQDAPFKM